MRDIDGAIAMMQGYVAQFEDGLVRLREEIRNDRNFRVFSEGYVDQILELRADIAHYRRLQQAERRPAKRKKLLKHGITRW